MAKNSLGAKTTKSHVVSRRTTWDMLPKTAGLSKVDARLAFSCKAAALSFIKGRKSASRRSKNYCSVLDVAVFSLPLPVLHFDSQCVPSTFLHA